MAIFSCPYQDRPNVLDPGPWYDNLPAGILSLPGTWSKSSTFTKFVIGEGLIRLFSPPMFIDPSFDSPMMISCHCRVLSSSLVSGSIFHPNSD